MIGNNRDDPKKFWRILNENLLKGNKETMDVLFYCGSDRYTTMEGSCEYMNNYLGNVGVKLAAQFGVTAEDNVYNNVYNYEYTHDDTVFTPYDVTRVVKNIDIHKSSDIDFLPIFALKDCLEVIIDQITYLFNQ